MNQTNQTPSMNQKIFDIGLSVETISTYLICCSLADADTMITTKNLQQMWNSTPKALVDSLQDLEKNNIVRRIVSDDEGNHAYRLTDTEEWDIL